MHMPNFKVLSQKMWTWQQKQILKIQCLRILHGKEYTQHFITLEPFELAISNSQDIETTYRAMIIWVVELHAWVVMICESKRWETVKS